ncbi:MAG: serine kinase [Planctomycetia bacterium]|nr:serine kinase [Planctomycetia bacterium]
MNTQNSPSPGKLFEEVFKSFQRAEKNKSSKVQYYNIASQTVKLRFAGSAMIPHMTPALSHLRSISQNKCSLTICVWDSVSTKVDLPLNFWENDIGIGLQDNDYQHSSSNNARIYFKENSIQGVYHVETKILSLFDMNTNLGILWINNAQKIPYYVSSSPFRSILQWWAAYNDLLMIHAGAIGNDRSGVLLAGKSGSGKSCTTMTCINSTLQYAGDDHILINTKSPFRSYSLYNACKLYNSDFNRFPEILKGSSNAWDLNNEKSVLFLHDIVPDKIVRGFQIKAILLPKIVNVKDSYLVAVSQAESLKALAPSTIFQLPGAGKVDFKIMAKLVKQIPSFILKLGSNNKNIPDIIANLL